MKTLLPRQPELDDNTSIQTCFSHQASLYEQLEAIEEWDHQSVTQLADGTVIAAHASARRSVRYARAEHTAVGFAAHGWTQHAYQGLAAPSDSSITRPLATPNLRAATRCAAGALVLIPVAFGSVELLSFQSVIEFFFRSPLSLMHTLAGLGAAAAASVRLHCQGTAQSQSSKRLVRTLFALSAVPILPLPQFVELIVPLVRYVGAPLVAGWAFLPAVRLSQRWMSDLRQQWLQKRTRATPVHVTAATEPWFQSVGFRSFRYSFVRTVIHEITAHFQFNTGRPGTPITTEQNLTPSRASERSPRTLREASARPALPGASTPTFPAKASVPSSRHAIPAIRRSQPLPAYDVR